MREEVICLPGTGTLADVPLPQLIALPLITSLAANSFLLKQRAFFFLVLFHFLFISFYFFFFPPFLSKVQFTINLKCPARMFQLVCDLHSMAVHGAQRQQRCLFCYS